MPSSPLSCARPRSRLPACKFYMTKEEAKNSIIAQVNQAAVLDLTENLANAIVQLGEKDAEIKRLKEKYEPELPKQD